MCWTLARNPPGCMRMGTGNRCPSRVSASLRVVRPSASRSKVATPDSRQEDLEALTTAPLATGHFHGWGMGRGLHKELESLGPGQAVLTGLDPASPSPLDTLALACPRHLKLPGHVLPDLLAT